MSNRVRIVPRSSNDTSRSARDHPQNEVGSGVKCNDHRILAYRNELQLKAIKQDRWNNSETDQRTERAFLDECKGPGRFSDKYGPQPVQTELDWKMPWGSWLDFKGPRDLSEAWKEAMK